MVAKWNKELADAIVKSELHPSRAADGSGGREAQPFSKEKEEYAIQHYKKACMHYEEFLSQLMTILPSDYPSLNGDVGRLCAEVQVALHTMLPAVCPYKVSTIDSVATYGLHMVSSLRAAWLKEQESLEALPCIVPPQLQNHAMKCHSIASQATIESIPVLLERLMNTMVAEGYIDKEIVFNRTSDSVRQKDEEGLKNVSLRKEAKEIMKQHIGKEKAGPSAALKRAKDIRLFMNFEREPWLLPVLMVDAGVIGGLVGCHDHADWYFNQAKARADRVYDLYSLGYHLIVGSNHTIPYSGASAFNVSLQQGLAFMQEAHNSEEADRYPIYPAAMCMNGNVNHVMSFVVYGHYRKAQKVMKSLFAKGARNFELLWAHAHMICNKRQDGPSGPGFPNLQPLLDTIVSTCSEGFSLFRRLSLNALLAKYYMRRGDGAEALKAVEDVAPLITHGALSQHGNCFVFLALCDLVDALIGMIEKLRSSSKPGRIDFLIETLREVMEKLGQAGQVYDVFRLRWTYYSTKVQALEGKSKKGFKSLGKLVEIAERKEMYLDMINIYGTIVEGLQGKKDKEPIRTLEHQLCRACGMYLTDNELIDLSASEGSTIMAAPTDEADDDKDMPPSSVSHSFSNIFSLLMKEAGEEED